MVDAAFRQHWREIGRAFLKIGAMSYGGPAIMGLMQTEFQEKRNWLSKERFLEGLALVNMLPGAGATQVGIYLGYVRGGWWGGLLAGLCFIFPAFGIMLALASAYAHYGTLPAAKDVFYGLGPVVVGIFAVAVYRLGSNAVGDRWQVTFMAGRRCSPPSPRLVSCRHCCLPVRLVWRVMAIAAQASPRRSSCLPLRCCHGLPSARLIPRR